MSISMSFLLSVDFLLASPLECSRLTLLFCATIFIELLFVGFINEFVCCVIICCVGGLVDRRWCCVDNVTPAGVFLRMFDVELDLLTEFIALVLSLMIAGTDFELSECARAFFWARICRDFALRKLLTLDLDELFESGIGFAGVVSLDLRPSRGELTELFADNLLLSVAIDDGVDEFTLDVCDSVTVPCFNAAPFGR